MSLSDLERRRLYARRRHEAIKSDPVKWEKRRAQAKAQDEKRRSNLEYRESEKKRLRDYKRKKRLEDPVWVERQKARQRILRAENKERYREYVRSWFERRNTTPSEWATEWNKQHPEIAKQRSDRSNKRRIPHFIAKYRRGDITFDELSGRLSEALVRFNERVKSEKPIGGDDSLRVCEGHTQPNETPTRCLESDKD